MAQHSELDARSRASRKRENLRNDRRLPQKDESIINRPCERSRKNRELDLADAWRDSLAGYVNVRLAILPRRATPIRYRLVSCFDLRTSSEKKSHCQTASSARDRRKRESGSGEEGT